MATTDPNTNLVLRKENFGAINLKYMENGVQAKDAKPCPFCRHIPVKYSGNEDLKYLRCYCGIWAHGLSTRGENDEDSVFSMLVREWNQRVGA